MAATQVCRLTKHGVHLTESQGVKSDDVYTGNAVITTKRLLQTPLALLVGRRPQDSVAQSMSPRSGDAQLYMHMHAQRTQPYKSLRTPS